MSSILNKLRQETSFRLIISGPPETGKSTLVSYLLAGLNYSNLFICCSTLNNTSSYSLFDEIYTVTNTFVPDEINNWVEWCKTFPGKKILILDDIIPFQLNRGQNKIAIENIFANGRHYGISVIVVLHYARSISPTTRLQYTHLVNTRMDIVSYQEFIKPYHNAKIGDYQEIIRLRVPRYHYLLFESNVDQFKLFKLIN